MRSEAILKRFDELGICRPGGLRRPGAGSLQGLLPGAPTEPDLRLIKPPLSQCLIPDPGRMDIGDQDLKTDNLLHDDVCSADLLERESAMSFHSRRRSRPSAQTTHRPRGGTCRERTQPRIAQMRSLSTGIGSARAKSGNHHSWRSSCLVPILPWVSSQRDKSFRTDVLV